MKNQWRQRTAILFTAFFLCAGLTLAAEVSIKGQGNFNNKETLIIDGNFVEQGSTWDGENCAWWNENENEKPTSFIVDFGELSRLTDILLQVDNNDTYAVEYSEDGLNFKPWLTIKNEYGQIDFGMDTFSSDENHPNYVKALDFEPVNARFVKIYAVAGEGDGSYSISEVQLSREPVPAEKK